MYCAHSKIRILFTYFPISHRPLFANSKKISKIAVTNSIPAMKYSLIIPVYNRPDEVGELLQSLLCQQRSDFEVILVEDGSTLPCREVADAYADRLCIRYFAKPNSGPGQSRNYGAERAQGEYLIVLDSDVVIPDGYLAAIDAELSASPTDAFGGPDRAHSSFTPIQKAINYSMTSFFTTGGIRGGKQKMDKFYPRSFNMGIRADVYRALGGFSDMRFGEDIDFSTRIFRGGYRCRLFPEAWVWHKRRADFRKFYRQVYNSGIARINLKLLYPDTFKVVHLLPCLFTLGMLCCALLALVALGLALGGLIGYVWAALCLAPPIGFSLIIFADSLRLNRSLRVATLSVGAAFVQLFGYGLGFISAWWKRIVCHRSEFQAFRTNFYK